MRLKETSLWVQVPTVQVTHYELLEASTGIEPVYTDLQSAASPLRQLAYAARWFMADNLPCYLKQVGMNGRGRRRVLEGVPCHRLTGAAEKLQQAPGPFAAGDVF